MRSRQQGITLMGLIVGAVVLIFAAVLAMKLVPSYIEFFAVKKALSGIAVDTRGRAASAADIRRAFENRSAIDDISSVKSSDLEINKEGNDYVVAAAWRREIPLFANIGVYIDFTASTRD
jgi:Tfp pilus assembly protein PilE